MFSAETRTRGSGTSGTNQISHRELISDLVSTLDPAEVLVELEQAASLLEAERCRLLGTFSESGLYRDLEYVSASAFLVDRCKVTPGRATRLVAQANALSRMQVTSKRWSDGGLASDQVRHLIACQQADPETFAAHEPMLCDTVASLSIVATGKALAYWRNGANPSQAAADQEKLYGQRRLHLSQTFEGMFRLDGYLDPLTGELVRTVLDALTPPPSETDTRTPAQRRADALGELSSQALHQGDLSQQGGEKPHLMVLVGAERLHAERSGIAETAGGTVFSQAMIELLSCDCAFSRVVFGPRSEITDLGRKTRVISPALRRAVIALDRHCQHPGCYRPAKWCDIDHIIAWQDGGETRLENLQLLCRYHHRLKHRRVGPKPVHPPRPFASREARAHFKLRARK